MIKRGIKATNERRTITPNAVVRHGNVLLRSNAVIRQTDGEMAQQSTFMTSVFMNVVVGELTAVREDTGSQATGTNARQTDTINCGDKTRQRTVTIKRGDRTNGRRNGSKQHYVVIVHVAHSHVNIQFFD